MSNETILEYPDSQEQIEHLVNDYIDEPKMYKVLLLNDDFTTFEFVIYVLMKFFHKSQNEAEAITKEIHQNGKGSGGVFSHDEAETRKTKAISCARKNNFPLRCTVEPA